jgi:hypothetical protein
LSALLGRPLEGQAGQRLGRLADIIVRLRGARYPLVTGLVARWASAGSSSPPGRSAIWAASQLLERAAFSRSPTVRLSAVSWRTRCFRGFSVVIPCVVPWGPLVLQVADLSQEDRDPLPLGADFGMRCGQGGLGVEGEFPPGRLFPVIGLAPGSCSPGPGRHSAAWPAISRSSASSWTGSPSMPLRKSSSGWLAG